MTRDSLMAPTASVGDTVVVERGDFESLIKALRSRGFRVVGPTVRDGAIVYDELTSSGDLPAGWTDVQDGGTYRLARRADEALFGYAVGPHSWKQFLHPPALRLWRARRSAAGFEVLAESGEPPRFAFLGVRACELHAIAIQDRVFLQGPYVDPHYRSRRENVFLVAVNCGQAGGTCFCASMGTGPRVGIGYDLALTEVVETSRHYFVVEVGSASGAEVLREVPQREAGAAARDGADRVVAATAASMGRTLDTGDIRELLQGNPDHPHWHQVAGRCLTCGNCTMVCPTCFCTTVEDVTDLAGEYAERWRRWDSCFTLAFSYIHGGSIRATAKPRYRQWMTHKLSTWIDQFGTSGCVGCGRCITWCPVAIDITEEARAIRAGAESAAAAGQRGDHGNA
jgi:ferredoxin